MSKMGHSCFGLMRKALFKVTGFKVTGFKVTWLSCLLLLALGGELWAQETEDLDSDRPEAWAMNYFTSVSLLSSFGTPYSRPPGSIEVGFELDWLPFLSEDKRRVGFNGIKEEDVNKAPIFARPRLTVGLPGRFALTLSYLPPIKIFGIKPNLFAFALERPLYERPLWRVGVRAYGQLGETEGDFTCPEDVARFEPGSPQNLFGCEEESSDTITMRYGGLEFSGSYRLEKMRGLTPYLAVAGNFLDTRTQVHAQRFGFEDRRRLSAGTWTFSMSAGLSYPLTERLQLSVGLFYTPLSVVRPPDTSSQNDALFNIRSMLTFRLR